MSKALPGSWHWAATRQADHPIGTGSLAVRPPRSKPSSNNAANRIWAGDMLMRGDGEVAIRQIATHKSKATSF